MTEPKPTPKTWIDRKLMFLRPEARPTPFIETMKDMSDTDITNELDSLTVIGLDPGGTTGWSVMRVAYADLINAELQTHKIVHSWYHGQVDCGTLRGNAGVSASGTGDDEMGISETGEAAGVYVLDNLISWNVPAAVVVEDFIIDRRRLSTGRDFLSPVRVTYRLHQLQWAQRQNTWHIQPVSDKSTANDERLRRWGFFTGTHADRHARDADRHALVFLRKLRGNVSRVEQAFPVVGEARERGII